MENFFKVLTEDAVVREEFLRQTTPEGAYLVAKPYLDDISKEEFVESLMGIARAMDVVQGNEFSEEDLTIVSGGVQVARNKMDFQKAMETFAKSL